jgi:hypothetical protein
MEQVARPRKARFVLTCAVLWDGGTNLLTWLYNRHDALRMGSVYRVSAYHIVADLVVGFVLGIVFGVLMRYLWRQAPRKKVSRNKTIVLNVLFWSAMAFLAFLLWKM